MADNTSDNTLKPIVIKVGSDVLQFPGDMDQKTIAHTASSHARKFIMERGHELQKLAPDDLKTLYDLAEVGSKPDLHNFAPSMIIKNLQDRTDAAANYAKQYPGSTALELGTAAATMFGGQIVRGIRSGLRGPTAAVPGPTQTVTKWEGGNPWSSNAGQGRPQAPAQLPSGAPAEPSMVAPQGGASTPPPVTQTTTTTPMPGGAPADPGGALYRAGGAAVSAAGRALPYWLMYRLGSSRRGGGEYGN